MMGSDHHQYWTYRTYCIAKTVVRKHAAFLTDTNFLQPLLMSNVRRNSTDSHICNKILDYTFYGKCIHQTALLSTSRPSTIVERVDAAIQIQAAHW